MTEPEKFCVDCRHYREGFCDRAPFNNSDELGAWLVTGEGPRPPQQYFHCRVERSGGESSCGPSGRFFEAKNLKITPEPGVEIRT